MLEIKVKVFQKETKEGKKFNVYKAIQKNGTLIDLKFIREVSPLPKEDSILTIKAEDMNIDYNRLYPCVWVKAVQEIKPYKAIKKIDPKINEMFGTTEDVSDKDLQF